MIVYHNCPENQMRLFDEQKEWDGKGGGIVEFNTDAEGNTIAVCRDCGLVIPSDEMPKTVPITAIQLSEEEIFELWDTIVWVLTEPTEFDDEEQNRVLEGIRKKLTIVGSEIPEQEQTPIKVISIKDFQKRMTESDRVTGVELCWNYSSMPKKILIELAKDKKVVEKMYEKALKNPMRIPHLIQSATLLLMKEMNTDCLELRSDEGHIIKIKVKKPKEVET